MIITRIRDRSANIIPRNRRRNHGDQVEAPRSWTWKVAKRNWEVRKLGAKERERGNNPKRDRETERRCEYIYICISLSLGTDDNCILHSLALYDRSRVIQRIWRPRYSHLSRDFFVSRTGEYRVQSSTV